MLRFQTSPIPQKLRLLRYFFHPSDELNSSSPAPHIPLHIPVKLNLSCLTSHQAVINLYSGPDERYENDKARISLYRAVHGFYHHADPVYSLIPASSSPKYVLDVPILMLKIPVLIIRMTKIRPVKVICTHITIPGSYRNSFSPMFGIYTTGIFRFLSGASHPGFLFNMEV